MDVPQLLLALGQQAQSSLWSQHYAQQNIDSSQQAGAADKMSPQQAAEHLALLQYWAALSRQQQDHFLSQQARSYTARTASQQAGSFGPDALMLLSQLQHIPGGPQALASYLSPGSTFPVLSEISSSTNTALPSTGTDLGTNFAQPRWQYPQEQNAQGNGSPTGDRRNGTQQSPLSAENAGPTGPGSSASSEGDTGGYRLSVPREDLGSPEQGLPAAFESGHHSSTERLASGLRCAKEKNRAAQRRFRERQKGLITALKTRADSLAKQVEDQKKVIEELRNDKQALQALLDSKDKSE